MGLPPVYKNHCPFDVLLLCWPCKELANRKCDDLKAELAEECTAPVDGIGRADSHQRRASRAARVLLIHGWKLPQDRREILEAQVCELLGLAPGSSLVDCQLEEAANLGCSESFSTHGSLVLASVGEDWPEFVKRWRRHF